MLIAIIIYCRHIFNQKASSALLMHLILPKH